MLTKIKSIIINQRYEALITVAYMIAGIECLRSNEKITKGDFACVLGFILVESCLKLYYKNERDILKNGNTEE